jgi:uncharacterized membrane protein YhaH (DUF805 family)
MGSLFSANGRFNRARYFGYMVALNILVWLTGIIIQTTGSGVVLAVGVLIMLGSWIIDIFITIKRFHDLDRPGIHFLLLLIPLYNIYLAFVLLLKKGTEGPNRYGEDPIRR